MSSRQPTDHTSVTRLMSGLILCSLLGCATSEQKVSTWTDQPVSQKADIYGEDDRKDIYDPSISEALQSLAQSVALVFNVRAIVSRNDASIRLTNWTMNDTVMRDHGVPLCEDEPFRSEPAPGFCTAFLISPTLVATAGHCINGHTRCEQMGFAFDYAKSDPDDIPTQISNENYYRCAQVLGHVYNPQEDEDQLISREYWYDWAVIQLDRAVENRPAVALETKRPEFFSTVHVIGHPSGLPMKVASGRVVTNDKERYFNTSLDIYKGNSGSPVFNADNGEVHGIVIRGSGGHSFKITEDGCARSKQCDEIPSGGECTGNHVLRVDPLQVFVNEDLTFTAQQGLVEDDEAPGWRTAYTFEDKGEVRIVTLKLNALAKDTSKLVVNLYKDGTHVALMKHPTRLGYRWTRSTTEFSGEKLEGEWIVDVVDEGGADVSIEWAKLQIGYVRPSMSLPAMDEE